MSNINFKKNMVDFKKDIDFNYISELLDNANYESAFSRIVTGKLPVN